MASSSAGGERHDVVPAKYRHNSTCSPLAASGKYVLAGVLYDGAMLVFDADTEKVVHVVPRPKDSVWWKSTAGAPAGEAYLATAATATSNTTLNLGRVGKRIRSTRSPLTVAPSRTQHRNTVV